MLSNIPIQIRDESELVHHLATPADLVAIMRRLPPGVADGLSEIVLCLGRDAQGDASDDDEPDPFTGRAGVEVLPGVHAGKVRGHYRPDDAVIQLHAYVHASDLADRRIKHLVLKLDALTTFVHEVAHHHDCTARVDDLEHVEANAERTAHAWALDVVVPYLETAYADEVALLGAWTAEHGGIDLPLRELVAAPRTPGQDGWLSWGEMFNVREAFATLLEEVTAGGAPMTTRVAVARELHYAEDYARARAILAGVAAIAPGHIGALILEADIDVHEEAYGRAEVIVRDVLARDPTAGVAWEVLFDALHGQARWAALVEAIAAGRPHVRLPWRALRQRAHAFLELGDDDALAADLAGLALGHVSAQQVAMGLRATWLLRQGRLEDGLATARAAEEQRYQPPIEAIAARFEAAHRLGRPEDAGRFTARDLDWLRRAGHPAWADRLHATYGDRVDA